MSKIRPSPSNSATLYKVGTKKKGNDGETWVIKERSNCSKFWTKYKKESKKTSYKKSSNKRRITRSKKPSKKASVQSKKGINIIRFTEAYTTADRSDNSVDFPISDISILLKSPKSYKERGSNAYVFGKRYPLKEYEYLGNHYNDGAQTSLINITGASKKELKHIVDDFDKWTDIYKKYKFKWDNINAIHEVQDEISPRILFVGESVGGDVGMEIYAHYHHGKIDSIILDNNYFFKNEEESDEE